MKLTKKQKDIVFHALSDYYNKIRSELDEQFPRSLCRYTTYLQKIRDIGDVINIVYPPLPVDLEEEDLF